MDKSAARERFLSWKRPNIAQPEQIAEMKMTALARLYSCGWLLSQSGKMTNAINVPARTIAQFLLGFTGHTPIESPKAIMRPI